MDIELLIGGEIFTLQVLQAPLNSQAIIFAFKEASQMTESILTWPLNCRVQFVRLSP
jgi:hypothetical protein